MQLLAIATKHLQFNKWITYYQISNNTYLIPVCYVHEILKAKCMKKFLFLIIITFTTALAVKSQCSSPTGDQNTYGTNNVWIGYVYDNSNFTTYRGYVNEGTSSNANFDQSFGGDNVTYNTTSCNVQTETFSVRYKLTKLFANTNYTFWVGGDDGYRLSLDGGSTWVINNWGDHGYTTSSYTATLNGTYNMVLEYYENSGQNRVSFAVAALCNGTEDTNIYGSNNVWYGYIYDGTSFNTYIGRVTEGTSSNPAFDENFGGSNAWYNTSLCSVETETFSARYRLTKNFPAGTYNFTVGADDGYRFSIDGGATWLINNWSLHSYTTTTSTAVTLNGNYNLVLEYYENTGDNRVTFNMQTLSLLPVSLQAFTAIQKDNGISINWKISTGGDPDIFQVERSNNGSSFSTIQTVHGNINQADYSITDKYPVTGVNYYRIRITDLTGIITYSKVVSVNVSGAIQQSVSIYPTVVTSNYFSVAMGKSWSKAEIIIADFSGRIVRKQQIESAAAGSAVKISTQGIQGKGIYLVSIKLNNILLTTDKIIIQ